MRMIFLTVLAALAGCANASPRIEVRDGWARATGAALPNAAVYLTISNSGAGPDRLVSLATSAADSAMIHSTSMDGGVMRMRPLLEGMEIAAGATIMLRPAGAHVMLTGLRRPLVAGQRVAARLRFARSGDRDIVIAIVAPGER